MRAISSAGECFLDVEEVASSNLALPIRISNSVARVSPCQGESRGFESHLMLN
jgi:hypothetical protein